MDKNKRPIDKLREGAGAFSITTPDDKSNITGMIASGENLLIVKENGIYEFKMADEIDPKRQNINTPNTIQQILPYGSSKPWVGAVVLTANDLLKKNILREGINTKRAMNLVIEIAQNIASAFEITESMLGLQKIELDKYDLKIRADRSFLLPSIKGIESKCKEYLQKLDHALNCLFSVVKVFYPDAGKGNWESFKEKLDQENPAIDNCNEIFGQMLPLLLFVRNARNCVEHPINEKRMIVKDFSVDAENNLHLPSIEIVHPKTPHPPVQITIFMNQNAHGIVNIVEFMLVLLCNRHIHQIQGFPVQVYEFPEDSRRTENVRYGYGIATANSIIPYG